MVVLEPTANFYRNLKIDSYWNRPKGIHLPVHDPIEKRQELLIDQERVCSEFSPLEFEKSLKISKLIQRWHRADDTKLATSIQIVLLVTIMAENKTGLSLD